MMNNTDQDILIAKERWRVATLNNDESYRANYEAQFSRGEISANQLEEALSHQKIVEARSVLSLYAIIDNKLYVPSDIEGVIFKGVPNTIQIRLPEGNIGVEPITEVRGVNLLVPNTFYGFIHDDVNLVFFAEPTLFKVDANGVPFEIFDTSIMEYRPYSEWLDLDSYSKDSLKPLVVEEISVSEISVTVEDAKLAVVETGLFKLRTQYIEIGDEPRDKSGGYPPGVFDLRTMISETDLSSLRQYLTMMPRSMLREFFMKKIWPDIPWNQIDAMYPSGNRSLPPSDAKYVTDNIYGGGHYKKNYEDLVWGAFIDLFNEANLEYINKLEIDPWTWEAQKTDAYYVSSNKDALDELSSQIQGYQDVALALDPKAKAIMEAYIQLPKIGDLGLEINRQNAIKELLKRKDYETAQAIVDAYRYAEDTVIGDTITKPIPYDIVTADGTAVVKATNS